MTENFIYNWSCLHCDIISLSENKPTSFGKTNHIWIKGIIAGKIEDEN